MNYLSFPGWAEADRLRDLPDMGREVPKIWTHATLVDDQLQDGDLYRKMDGGLLRWDERMGTWTIV